MGRSNHKIIIGIVGGIGSGKSTVAGEFSKLGCKVIDADAIAHELLELPDVLAEIAKKFSQAIFNKKGKIDRTKLAKIVFVDEKLLNNLTDILHSRVLERADQLIEKYNSDKSVKAIVLDMPLLIEVDWVKKCQKIVFVECQWAKRVKRVQKNDKISEKQLKMRENLQISLDNKRSLADNRINNNSGLQTLAKQVSDIFKEILEEF